MTEPENIVLEHLRQIRAAIGNLAERLDENTARLGHVERAVAQNGVQLADVNIRLDNFNARLTRIEQRIGLIEVTP